MKFKLKYPEIPSLDNLKQIIQNLFKLIYPKVLKNKKESTKILKLEVLSMLESEIQKVKSDSLCAVKFLKKIPYIKKKMKDDLIATLQADPAANSIEEIIVSYPGIYAITIYRIAHELYLLDVPFIPRMLSELAHNKTGIDIHPGASIGHSFFIDHGTGIVIGETTIIGNRVKIYQGVTLGALSLEKGQELKGKKRHPTIQDDVVIYANATILGGNTIIGKNVTIGSNVFILESIKANMKVLLKRPDLILKEKD